MFHQITQPGRREDVQLLGEWLQQSMHRNQYENSDGHFEDTEAVFLLHSIAFLEIVRQVMNAKFLCNSDLLIKLFFFSTQLCYYKFICERYKVTTMKLAYVNDGKRHPIFRH